jgi:hypothetical protein
VTSSPCRIREARHASDGASQFGSPTELSPVGPQEGMEDPGLVHRPDAGPVVPEVVELHPVEIRGDPPLRAERPERPALDPPAEVAPVRRIAPVSLLDERVDGDEGVIDPDRTGDGDRALDLLAAHRVAGERDGVGVAVQSPHGQRGDDPGVNAPREGDHARADGPKAVQNLGLGPGGRKESGGCEARQSASQDSERGYRFWADPDPFSSRGPSAVRCRRSRTGPDGC